MNSIPLISKLPNSGTTIFTIMSSLAAETNAVNLGQGFPDYPMNQELIELSFKAMKDGFNQYVHMNGYMPLRESICDKINFLYQSEINAKEEITITPGGTYAIYTSLTSIIGPGDEVIVFEPAYDSYIPGIELNGGKAIRIQLLFPTYKIDWNEVRNKITSKTKAILINSPHNPTGSILTDSDIKELRNIISQFPLYIISDEVYEHLIFDGQKHLSILRYPDLFERSFVCFSFGKVYHCTGWKLGYCVAPEYLMNEFRKVHQFNCFSCDSPKQVALASFLKKKDHYLNLGKFLEGKRNYFQTLMASTKFKALPSYGSYFQIYSYSALSNETEKEFAIRITKQYGVAAIPVSAFYQDETNHNVVRFCFAKKESTLENAAKRLINIEPVI
ncbi:MAG TPA: methionine aminotransferase [Flavisolibacter sp.]|nr:methionine aminotransferase [Flavisolibacter sp.]